MSPDTDDRSSEPHGGFPGGRPRLPRLTRPKRRIEPVETPPTGSSTTTPRTDPPTGPARAETAAGAATDVEHEADGTFADYFSVESLFGASPDRDEEHTESEDSYRVLGISRRATWKEISQAHRRLVSMLHPDRYVDAEPEVREAAERRVRDVNEAFSEIRRQRASSSA